MPYLTSGGWESQEDRDGSPKKGEEEALLVKSTATVQGAVITNWQKPTPSQTQWLTLVIPC